MKFKVKAKTMFIDGEAKKTRDREEIFVTSAERYALMAGKLVELIEEIEEQKPADEETEVVDAEPAEEETEVVDAEPAEEPAKPKRSRKTTKDDA